MSADVKIKVSEPIFAWQVGENLPRRYVVTTQPFGKLRRVIATYTFSAASGAGEQREQIESHVKKLKSEMLSGYFTPTGFNGSLNKTHIETLKERDGIASFELTEENPLRWVDGGHRMKALTKIREQFDEMEDKTLVNALDDLPITTIIYLDGDPKDDFIHLQAGRSIDRSHLNSLKIRRQGFSSEMNPVMKLAMNVAQALNKKESGSHLSRYIKFDTRGASKSLFPSSTILAPGSSTFATNIVGGAKIALHFKKSEEWLTAMYVAAYQLLDKKLPAAVEAGKILAPPPEGGIGQSLMLLGVGNMLAFRCGVLEHEKPNNDDIDRLVKCVKSMLSSDLPEGSLAIGAKRRLIAQFAKVFLKDLGREGVKLKFVEELPALLFEMIPPSAFEIKLPKEEAVEAETETAAEKPAKPKKPRNRKPQLVTSSG